MIYLILSVLWIYAICIAFSLGYWELGIALAFLTCLLVYRRIVRR